MYYIQDIMLFAKKKKRIEDKKANIQPGYKYRNR